MRLLAAAGLVVGLMLTDQGAPRSPSCGLVRICSAGQRRPGSGCSVTRSEPLEGRRRRGAARLAPGVLAALAATFATFNAKRLRFPAAACATERHSSRVSREVPTQTSNILECVIWQKALPTADRKSEPNSTNSSRGGTINQSAQPFCSPETKSQASWCLQF